jgi:hypothetical protein
MFTGYVLKEGLFAFVVRATANRGLPATPMAAI